MTTMKLSPDRRPVVSKHYTDVPVQTDLVNPLDPNDTGELTLAEVKAIDDLIERGRAAAALTKAAEKLAEEFRSTRDMAGLVLIQPYLAVQRPYDDTMAAIDRQLEDGAITQAEAREMRQIAKDERRAGMENVDVTPVDVYRNMLGVSRGLFVRMTHRAPQQLPEFLDDDGKPMTPEALTELAVNARKASKVYNDIAQAARTIRDEDAISLLYGNARAGRQPMSNAELARLFNLTTARVAQIRYGTR